MRPVPWNLGRATRQRAEIMEMLAKTAEFIGAQEVHNRLRQSGSTIGLTTVYRTLHALAEAGEIDTVRLDNGEQHYRRCSNGRHHHLICRHCARTVEIRGPGIESWAQAVAGAHDFVEVNHTLELFGTCASCRDVLDAGPDADRWMST
ncbi:Fur family transcriptional regulator [Dactylosporangium sp. NPDC005572]|uniref:Fur family transcriptional regulator n=1 Tax=Dactylosporangium sp. NPDC005572 TaxID=3156889 RepID=UPI0033B25EF3